MVLVLLPSKHILIHCQKGEKRSCQMVHTHTHECVCPLNETIKISQKTEHIKKRLRGESATSGHCAALGNAQKNGI